jgi:hypothetical protein
MNLTDQQERVRQLLHSLPKKTYDAGIATRLAWQLIKAEPTISDEDYLGAVSAQCPAFNPAQPTPSSLDANLVTQAIREFQSVNAGVYAQAEIAKRIWAHAKAGGALDAENVKVFMLSQPPDPVIAAKEKSIQESNKVLQARANRLVAVMQLEGQEKSRALARMTHLVFSTPDVSDAEMLTQFNQEPSSVSMS